MSSGGWCSARLADRGLDEITWVVVDTETTGLDANTDDLREVAALVVSADGHRLDEITWFAADGAVARTDAIERIAEWSSQGATFVAHNAAFDLMFLGREARWKAPERWLCTMRLCGSRASLEAFAARLGVEVVARHTAIGDAVTLARAVVVLVERARERGLRTVAGLAVVCPVVTGSEVEWSTNLAQWDGVRAMLDAVTPARFPDRAVREAFHAVVSALPIPELGPANPGEQARVVAALERAGIDALTLDLLLADLTVPKAANSDNSTDDT